MSTVMQGNGNSIVALKVVLHLLSQIEWWLEGESY